MIHSSPFVLRRGNEGDYGSASESWGDLQGCRLINMCPAMTDGCTLKEPRFT